MPDINTPNYPVTESPRLSPNPKLTTSYEDGGRGTPTIVVTEAKEQIDTTGVSLPEYTGDYEITENGTLETAGKVLSRDIVVAIPEYEGSYSVTENGTLPTEGKVMTSDLAVNVQAEGLLEEAWEAHKKKHPRDWSNVFRTDRGYGILAEFQNFDALDFSGSENVTDMSGMFEYCASLVNLPAFNTPSLYNASYMFYGCASLVSVPAYDLTNASNLSGIFTSCPNLETIHAYGMHSSFNIQYSTKFTREALLEIINNCADLTGRTSEKLTMGSGNLAKLTEEDKLIATNKNWTLA